MPQSLQTSPIDKRKKVIFSGIQPTGFITLGNYIGAVRNWIRLQEECNCIYSIVNLHAITVRQDPIPLKQNTLDAYALILACGIDPQRSITFLQSHVPAHTELAWVLNCYTQFGELGRMTQFKDKSARYTDNINAGLFTYPTLMAADILLYQADLVPVGADQKQHLELCRDIAGRFNGIYGSTFTIPDSYIPAASQGARVMSLQDPSRKMSKSDPNPKGVVAVLDKPEVIMKKFRSAVTDSETEVAFREGKDGINNLMGIYSVLTGKGMDTIADEFIGKGYGDFKTAVGEVVVEELRPIRERYEVLRRDKAYLEETYRRGAQKATQIAEHTLDKVYRKVGFLL